MLLGQCSFSAENLPTTVRGLLLDAWQGLSDVEFATLEYVDWFKHRRLHSEITDGPGYATPADFEADYYRSPTVPTDQVETQTPECL